MGLESVLKQFEFLSDISKDNWYLIVSAVITAVNQPQDVQHVYSFISEQVKKSNGEDKVLAQVVLRIREAVLKSFVIIGFPKTINTLNSLRQIVPDSVNDLLPKSPIRKEETWSDIQAQRQRGKELFERIYERHSDRVMQSMDNAYPDLAQTALYHLYGPMLGETSVLNAKEASFVTVACLMIENLPLQLAGHVHGAVHNGATKEEMDRVATMVCALGEYYNVEVAKPKLTFMK
ncbi:hypothetical protein K501DRAFT_220847 [Backusella circina FSU 941]|nr:hypothetical protein K501DRAFT_220847 [Backusella circina FSU 941]